jgi:hypothetical protein
MAPDEVIGECHRAEDNLKKLACKDGKGRLLGEPNLRGEPFWQTCVTMHEAQIPFSIGCLSAIMNCNEKDSCMDTTQGLTSAQVNSMYGTPIPFGSAKPVATTSASANMSLIERLPCQP